MYIKLSYMIKTVKTHTIQLLNLNIHVFKFYNNFDLINKKP